MGKGGRYLDKTKKPKKKGRGWRITLIVLLVLAVLIGGIAFAMNRVLHGMLNKINRAEVIERDDVSDEDFAYWETWNPNAGSQNEEPEVELPAETAVGATGETEGTTGA